MFRSLMKAMGLVKVQGVTPADLGPVSRRMFLRGISVQTLQARVQAYEQMNAKGHAHTLTAYGPVEGWLAVELPGELHSYYAHNLTFWIPDGEEGAVALLRSGGVADAVAPEGAAGDWRGFPAYWLAPHPQFGDSALGGLDDGTPMAVFLPKNTAFEGADEGPPVPLQDVMGKLPAALTATDLAADLPRVELTFDAMALGADLNPNLVREEVTLERYRRMQGMPVGI